MCVAECLDELSKNERDRLKEIAGRGKGETKQHRWEVDGWVDGRGERVEEKDRRRGKEKKEG